MKTLKVYVGVITDVSERCWSFTSEQSTAEQATNDADEFTDDFDDICGSFMQLSDRDCYSRLICSILTKDSLLELFLLHVLESCHLPAAGSADSAKTPQKLAKLVAQMLSKLAANLVSRLPVDNKQRITVSELYSEGMSKLLADTEHDEFVCSTDFVDILNSFVPVMSHSVLMQLTTVLLQSPEDCVEQLDDGLRTLSHRGRLIVNVLQQVLDQLDLIQPEMLSSTCLRLCKIVKLVPSDDTVCNSLTAVAKRTPLFASNVTEGVVSSLLKAGTQPSLSLMTALAVDNENCKQLMVLWFARHKTWTREPSLPLYVGAILFVLKTCEKGLMFTCFIFVIHL